MTFQTTGDIVRYRGDTAPDQFVLTDADGEVIDISSGYEFKLTLNMTEDPTDDTDMVVSISGTVNDGPNGVYEFPWTEEQADQPNMLCWYDVQVTDPSDGIKTVEKALYQFSGDLSDRT